MSAFTSNTGVIAHQRHFIDSLYEGKSTADSNTTIGKTTLSEAQLMGRGARYFPFTLDEGQYPYTRI